MIGHLALLAVALLIGWEAGVKARARVRRRR